MITFTTWEKHVENCSKQTFFSLEKLGFWGLGQYSYTNFILRNRMPHLRIRLTFFCRISVCYMSLGAHAEVKRKLTLKWKSEEGE